MASEEVADTTTSSAADDAKARREARKARILGAGNDRLARITKTGRGGEADVLYSTPPKPLGGGSGMDSSKPDIKGSIDDDEVLQRANAALRGGTGGVDDDPQDVDISQPSAQNNPFLAMMQQQHQGGQQSEMPQDIQGMMRAMQEAMMGASQGQPGGNMSGGHMPQFPFAQQQQQQQEVQTGPSAIDTIFNLARALIFAIFGVALVYGALIGKHAEPAQSVTEKVSEQIVDKFAHMSTLHRWARLAYEKPAQWEAQYFTMESFGLPIPQGVPIFWLFITLEIGLQSMRIMLQRRNPPPPGFLLKVASFIPSANIQFLIRTLASYLPLLDAFINDIAVVVFTIGCAILFASWKAGFDPLLAPSDATIPQATFVEGIQNVARDILSESGQAIPDIVNPAGPPM